MKKTCFLILLLLPLGWLAGCSTLPDPKFESNEFFEQWRELAAKSEPVIRPEEPPKEQPEPISPPLAAPTEPGEKPRPVLSLAERTAELHAGLPTQPVTIHLVDVPLGTALRSLARSAGQNIIINPSVTGTVNIHVNQVPWNDVFLGIVESYGLVAAKEGGVIRVMSVEDLRRQVERKGLFLEEEQVSPLVTRVVPVRFSQPESLAESLVPMLSRDKEGAPRGSVTVDRHTRSLIIRDTAENLARLTTFLTEVDQATPQILIEAHIVETSQDMARELGVQWGNLWLGSQRLTDAAGGSTHQVGNPLGQQLAFELAGEQAGQVNFYAAALSGNILELQLQALQRAGKVNILSRPSIATLDNHEALLESGTEVPYQTVEDGTVTVQYKDAVLRLLVTPQVISSRKIKLQIEAKKDEVDLTRTVVGNPFIIKKLAQTNLIVENGSTVVIAGLARERNSRSRTGVPGLQNVPLLGELFQSNTRSGDFEELLIFISPRILSPEEGKPGDA